MKNTRKVYKIIAKGDGGKYIRMPQTADGYYIRRADEDGTVTFSPLDLDVQEKAAKQSRKKKPAEDPAE